MKRSAPITRGKPPRRKTRLNQVGAKARREAPSLAELRRAVRERAGGLCELATPECPPGPHEGHHAHHRRLRSQGGGHGVENGLWCCFRGHRWAHDNPEVSYGMGWLWRSGPCCESCGAPLDALGSCTGCCDPADAAGWDS